MNSQPKDNKEETKVLKHQRDDCPLDKDELGLLFNLPKIIQHKKYYFKLFILGRSTWKLLHTIAATYSDKPSQEDQSNMEQFINLIPKVYPCEVCANDFSEMLVLLYLFIFMFFII